MGKTRERQRPARMDNLARDGGVICGVLYGELPTKSNQRRIFRGISVKSQKALDFVERVKLVAKISPVAMLKGATSVKDVAEGVPVLYLKAFVYGQSFQRDLDVELLPDALQAAGVINNDRAIRQKHYWWALDTGNPRVVFEIGFAR